MHGPEVLIPIVGSIGFFGMICYIFAVVGGGRNRLKMAEIRSHLQQRMLEKFGSAAEFVEFAKTDEGRKLLENSAIERPILMDRTLSWVRRGIVLTAFGLGFGVLTLARVVDSDGGVFVTVMSLAVGIGMLVGAVVSRKLGKAWNIEEETYLGGSV
jgi:hypothetical protein